MSYTEQIEQLEKQMHDRMNHLAGQDPLCNRIMGRIEILKQVLLHEEAERGLNGIPTGEGAESGIEEAGGGGSG